MGTNRKCKDKRGTRCKDNRKVIKKNKTISRKSKNGKFIKNHLQIRKKSHKINNKKGGTYEKVNCCMCGKETNINALMIPQICLIKNGANAHRICKECWWDPVYGFAREGSPHGCPGCEKKLSLTNFQNNKPIFIDLSEG